MDTNKLKRFASEARSILIYGVKQKMKYWGFDNDGSTSEIPDKKDGGAIFMGDIISIDQYNKWMSLYADVKATSFNEVAEEVAYTWFNRLVAIRIMQKNKLIAPVLEYESPDVRVPVIVANAQKGQIEGMNESEMENFRPIMLDSSKIKEQFAILIVAFCHAQPVLRNCFGLVSDYTELLLPDNIIADGGFVDMLNQTDEIISDDDFKSPELIGWLYQF
nr:SAM-dependent methyltransferase [Bacteroidales bacterium]